MSPATLALLVQFIELAIREEPAIALELHNLFSNPNPSAADWQALREKVLGESFESLAPAAAANLPAPAPEPPLVDDAGAADKLKMFGTTDPNNATETAAGPVTDQASADKAAQIPAVAGVVCPQCGSALIPNSPGNCNCQ